MSPQNMEGSTLLLQEGGPLPQSKSGPSWHKDRFELLKKKKSCRHKRNSENRGYPLLKEIYIYFTLERGPVLARGPCACQVAQSCPTPCDPMDCSPPGSSIRGDSPGKNTEVGLPCSPSGDLPNLGIELASLIPPALAGGLFYH